MHVHIDCTDAAFEHRGNKIEAFTPAHIVHKTLRGGRGPTQDTTQHDINDRITINTVSREPNVLSFGAMRCLRRRVASRSPPHTTQSSALHLQ